MISLADILLLHEFSILDYGGMDGIRDEGLLLSAIERPFHTFDGKDLYPTPYQKAVSLAESIIINHPFVDGNKRVGFLAMIALLNEHNIDFIADQDDAYACVLSIATGKYNFDHVANWLKANTRDIL